jgi:hypothetical protein
MDRNDENYRVFFIFIFVSIHTQKSDFGMQMRHPCGKNSWRRQWQAVMDCNDDLARVLEYMENAF